MKISEGQMPPRVVSQALDPMPCGYMVLYNRFETQEAACVPVYVSESVCLCVCMRVCLSVSVCVSICFSVCVCVSIATHPTERNGTQ